MELVLFTNIYFHYYLVLKMGLFQSLDFVDNFITNPNWDFQHIYTAGQIKSFLVLSYPESHRLKMSGQNV